MQLNGDPAGCCRVASAATGRAATAVAAAVAAASADVAASAAVADSSSAFTFLLASS